LARLGLALHQALVPQVLGWRLVWVRPGWVRLPAWVLGALESGAVALALIATVPRVRAQAQTAVAQ